MCDKEASNHRDGAFCVDRNLKAPLGQSVLLATVHEDAHESCGDDDSQQSSNGQRESEGANEESDGSSSSGKDMMSNLSLQDEEKGKVSPLRALSHVAHIKRKQDYLQSNSGDTQFHPCMKKISASTTYASSSKKGLKQVQFQLEPPVYEKLMRLVVDRHQGSLEKFILATLDAFSREDNAAKRFSVSTSRKQGFSKWKRARFDQLKGTETQELALAFKSLAQCTPNAEVTSELMHIPWQELNMIQVQKMLEETKKMLLINEKVHDCPIVGCGKRFTTPGHLRDHLNEHR
ncbi:hypothetical protein KP509_25G015700 [Ceratopteris richardii]|uniref:C2H2-type domain-containing protein n=1 Tax=Ceratopteris richardii TaxID=49495 RepID=A0A8T2RPZ2_CERRI|nr:hypothetical protein KP509_25G015700 [Ceratopteris richardii]